MEKQPHKNHCLRGFMQITFFFACNPFKLCEHRFQGGDLCVIMEKRPHKTHKLSDFVQISEFLACKEEGPHRTQYHSGFVQISEFFDCNAFKLCSPRFHRGVIWGLKLPGFEGLGGEGVGRGTALYPMKKL